MISLTAMLRNEVGWFDKEENNADTLSMRLANDATFVRAAFSNRLSIFIQDTAAVSVALLIGMLLGSMFLRRRGEARRPTPFTTPRRLWRTPRRRHTHIGKAL